ncbi:putative periaxin-like [Capsicum annuum]|nr:putative periaxin-like [Capsicum annuum]
MDGIWLHTKSRERMADATEGFLNEPIRRSLIQVLNTLWEKVPRCKIHDLVRDLTIEIALEVKIFDIYDPRKHSISSFCLRHVIHGQGQRYLSLDFSKLKLRSIMLYDRYFFKLGLINFHNEFQHVYVLHLVIHSVTKLPDVIGNLYHLKFLALKGIHNFPSSLGNLKNLQTLHVNEYILLCKLPPKTALQINVRHFIAPYSKPLKRISKLTSLQLLSGISYDQWKDVYFVNLVNL